MKSKKIFIVAPYGFNDRMSSFIEFVSARVLAQNGWMVFALTKSDNDICRVEHTNGIKIHRYNTLLRGMYFGIRILFIERPSIVHCHNLRNNRVGIIMSMLSKLLRIPLLFTEYGLLHDHYLTNDRNDPLNTPLYPERVITSIKQLFQSLKNRNNIRTTFSSYIFHWPLANADAIIFVSNYNLHIAKALGLKCFIYLPYIMDNYRGDITGVDCNKNTKSHHEQILETLKKIKNEQNLLFIGQMKLRKGWDILLRAVSYIPESIIKNIVIVSASGNMPPREFKLLAESLGITERVVFLGPVLDSKDLEDIYKISKVVAVPSLYEGFGLVPVGAFAMKKPVVASNVTALNDFLVDGYNAVLVPAKDSRALADALARVISDEKLVSTIIQGGCETLQKMKSEEYYNKWLSFYEQFLHR